MSTHDFPLAPASSQEAAHSSQDRASPESGAPIRQDHDGQPEMHDQAAPVENRHRKPIKVGRRILFLQFPERPQLSSDERDEIARRLDRRWLAGELRPLS